jgi:hypothetical protein
MRAWRRGIAAEAPIERSEVSVMAETFDVPWNRILSIRLTCSRLLTQGYLEFPSCDLHRETEPKFVGDLGHMLRCKVTSVFIVARDAMANELREVYSYFRSGTDRLSGA